MSLSMYKASVPGLIHGLTSLSAILSKALAHLQAKGIAEDVFLQARLAPDMFALVKQVQIATDMAKGGAARLAGVDVPSYADDETSFAQLEERISKTVAFLQTFQPGQIDGSEEKAITLTTRRGDLHFNGQDYLLGFVLPNFYFHITTAYDILRHNGVELGKSDYLGNR